MKCNYRFCGKEINYGRPDRKFCNKKCKSMENKLVKELKSLRRNSDKAKDFIEKSKKIHNNKFGYELVVYENCRTKVTIVCPTHGPFCQTPDGHLYKSYGCEQCSRDSHKLTLLSDDRVNNLRRIHNNKYQYNDLSVTKGFINITCPDHGMFKQYLYFHEYGHGCTQCNSSSRGEDYIKNYLDNRGIKYQRNHIFKDCRNKKGLRFDFYLSELSIIVEYDGEHHFLENKYFGSGNLEYVRKNDEIKNQYCLDNNIKLVRIPYYEFKNIESILNLHI